MFRELLGSGVSRSLLNNLSGLAFVIDSLTSKAEDIDSSHMLSIDNHRVSVQELKEMTNDTLGEVCKYVTEAGTVPENVLVDEEVMTRYEKLLRGAIEWQ